MENLLVANLNHNRECPPCPTASTVQQQCPTGPTGLPEPWDSIVQGLVFIITTAYPAIMWYYDKLKTFFKKKQARANGIETIEMD